jgi:hypothetical protein
LRLRRRPAAVGRDDRRDRSDDERENEQDEPDRRGKASVEAAEAAAGRRPEPRSPLTLQRSRGASFAFSSVRSLLYDANDRGKYHIK